MPSYRHRTAITRLEVSDEDVERLEETIDAWRCGANIAATAGWEHEETRKTKLQALVYDSVRERTTLGSQHAVLAIHQAAEALGSVTERRERGRRVSKPTFTSPSVTYDARTMTLFEDEGEVTLATTEDRIRCSLALPDDEDGFQFRYLNDDGWELTESTLTVRDDEYYLHLGFRQRREDSNDGETARNRTVLGVDLGIENLAVTSTAHFESSGELRHRHRQFEEVCGGLQETGTESAHRTYVRRGDAEARYNRDYLHRVSKAIVEEAVAYDCNSVVFEDLRYIRDDAPSHRAFHRWAHHQLVTYVSYKADERGIETAFVDPQNTSKRCSECGHVDEDNRTDRDLFHCQECGMRANADYNAAKNVGLRYVRDGQQHSSRTGDGRLALKSGTVRPGEGFAPYSSGSRDTDESVPSEANAT